LLPNKNGRNFSGFSKQAKQRRKPKPEGWLDGNCATVKASGKAIGAADWRGCLIRASGGMRGKLSSVEMGRLQNYLTEFGAADLAEARSVIEQSFGVRYTIGGVSRLCRRLRIKLKTARPSNVKKDVGAVQAYKKTLAF